MLFANFLSVVYNIVDTMWIGQIVGLEGLAVTATTFPIALILIAFGLGISISVNVLSGQYVGSNNAKFLGYFANVSYTVVLFLSIVLVSLLFIFAESIIILLNTPQSILEESVLYFRISVFRYPFFFYYMVIASLLRSMGDTIRPMIFLGVSSIVNIILDPVLMLGLCGFPEFGLNGAAIATVFSQFLSVFISVLYLKSKNNIIMENPFKLIFDFNIIKKILSIGLPFSTAQLITSLSWMVLMSLINTYGPVTSAAVGAASKIEGISYMFLTSLGSGIATISSQSIGAGRIDKIKIIFREGLKLCLLISSVVAIISVIFSENILLIFTTDMFVVMEGRYFVYFIMPSLVILSIVYCSNGILNSAGKSKEIMLFSFISLIIVRVPLSYILSNYFGIFGIWSAMFIATVVNMALSVCYYLSKKWMKNAKII